MYKLLVVFLWLILINQLFLTPVLAQTSPGEITTVYTISDKEAEDGDIIQSSADGMARSSESYDPRMFGVLQFNPTVAYKSFDTSLKPIIRLGQASVNVTTLNGDINPGDFITSSSISGKGQKANQSGYVIGIALTGLKEGEGSKLSFQTRDLTSSKITVAVKVEYAEIDQSRFGSPKTILSALFRNLEDPSSFIITLRYIAAMIVIIISFVFGFVSFTRSLPKAVEAIGRNPLATRSIQISMIINIALTLGSILAGIIAAIIIIRL